MSTVSAVQARNLQNSNFTSRTTTNQNENIFGSEAVSFKNSLVE
jgi:hypothetical protein